MADAAERPSKIRRTSPLGHSSTTIVSVPPTLLGLRGLLNLGNSCFMNCVLQVLLHCPPVRRFFLSDGHNRFECMARTHRSPDATGGESGESASAGMSTARRPCVACEMDGLFTQCFSGKRSPFSPHSFLHAMWTSADHVAGYEQQDAHEFLIAALAKLYEAVGSLKPASPLELQHIFTGVMRSDVTCLKCSSKSTKYEDFQDISLDLSRASAGSDDPAPYHSTLAGCLRSFTRSERLSFSERCWCSKCGALEDSAKQLSFHRLPNVLCVHLKRFKHSTQNAQPSTSTKIDSFVEFPLYSLNMRPHTSAYVCADGARDKTLSAEPLPEHMYDLFCATVHHGTMQNGHYTCYVRSKSDWFHCDDALVISSCMP
jgi:ubiquitin carboxyl-terminal hydrolase 22/27/51